MSLNETAVKRIDFDSKKFVANKNVYHIEDKITVGRWEIYQTIVPEINYGKTAVEIFEELKAIYELQNQAKFADVSVRLHDLITSSANIADRIDPCLRMCALFMNTKDEDRTNISEAQIAEKIDDWKTEGISYEDFFLAGVNLIPGLRKNLLAHFQNSLEGNSPLESQ